MSGVLFVVLPLALLIAGSALVAFIWAVRGGQLDDIESPPRRILYDDEHLVAKDESN